MNRVSNGWDIWLVAWSVPSHYLYQCWNIVNWTLRNKLPWNINGNSYISIHEYVFESAVCEMSVIQSRSQCVKWLCCISVSTTPTHYCLCWAFLCADKSHNISSRAKILHYRQQLCNYPYWWIPFFNLDYSLILIFSWWQIYSELSIYRDDFSLNNSRKTPHSWPVRARYGVSFVRAKFDRSFANVIFGLCALYHIVYDRDISRV